jgi:transposase
MNRAAYFIGVDLHRTVIQVCVLDQDGEIAQEARFRGESLGEGLAAVKFIQRWKGARVAVEAVGMNRWFVNALQGAKCHVIVVDPAKLNLRALGKKTDRRDAYEIARRLRLGDLDKNAKTYYPSDEEYGVRKVIRTRHQLVRMRQKTVNQIRGILNAYRIPAPRGALYGKRAIAALKEIATLCDDLLLCLRSLVKVLEGLQARIKELSKRIDAEGKKPEVAAAIAALPSVKAQTAVTLIAELGDVKRFKNTRAVASYAGLVPRVANSADKSHHGPLTKRGNPELRWIVSEWAVRLLSRHERVRAWAAPMLRRMHKNKVRMALARRLLVGCYVMLRRGEVFSLDRCLAA